MALRFLTLLLVVLCAQAKLFKLDVTDDTRQVIHLQSFGFFGHLQSNCTIVLKKFTVSTRGKDDAWVVATPDSLEAPVGFALESRETVNGARLEENVRYPNEQCFAYWKREDRMSIAYPTKKRVPDKASEVDIASDLTKPQVFEFTDELNPGLLSLFFYNCNQNSRVTFSIEVIQYNTEKDTKFYLDAGTQSLPLYYLLFGVIYSAIFLIWVAFLYKNSKYIQKIHWMMSLLIFLKALSLLLESAHLTVILVEGHGELYADLPYYFTLSVKGVLLFFVILLVGTGWSFIKPFLTENEKKIMMVVVPLVLVDSIAVIIEDQISEGNEAWNVWRDIRRILDVVACCAVLLPVVWSIRNLRDASTADGKAARSLVRLRQFRTFYALLVAYIYYTRIVVPLVKSALHWREIYIAAILEEFGTGIFYVVTGYKFRPMEDNPHLSLATEDFDDISLRAELEAQEVDVHMDDDDGVVVDGKSGKRIP